MQGLHRCLGGKGGVIKRITQSWNPRICRVVALGTPTERERGQWCFQRYVAELPARGEIVLFDRSWYNRAGVEHVMGFCTEEEYLEFLRSCPLFEEMLVRSGMHLIKYWFSVNDEEQERRFHARIRNPIKRWKLSPMDFESRNHWVDYSKAKDEMFSHTDREKTPWYVINADDKKKARLNCIAHLLQQIPYRDMTPVEIEVPPRQEDTGYKRPKKRRTSASYPRYIDLGGTERAGNAKNRPHRRKRFDDVIWGRVHFDARQNWALRLRLKVGGPTIPELRDIERRIVNGWCPARTLLPAVADRSRASIDAASGEVVAAVATNHLTCRKARIEKQ